MDEDSLPFGYYEQKFPWVAIQVTEENSQSLDLLYPDLEIDK